MERVLRYKELGERQHYFRSCIRSEERGKLCEVTLRGVGRFEIHLRRNRKEYSDRLIPMETIGNLVGHFSARMSRVNPIFMMVR